MKDRVFLNRLRRLSAYVFQGYLFQSNDEPGAGGSPTAMRGADPSRGGGEGYRVQDRRGRGDHDEPPEQTVSDIADPMLSRREPTSRIGTRRNLVAGVIALTVAMVLTAIIAFAWLVWPTPWLYHTTQGIRLREHRWSGRMERLSPTRGWLPVLNTVEGGGSSSSRAPRSRSLSGSSGTACTGCCSSRWRHSSSWQCCSIGG